MDYINEARRQMFAEANPDGGVAVGSEAVRSANENWNREHPDQQVNFE